MVHTSSPRYRMFNILLAGSFWLFINKISCDKSAEKNEKMISSNPLSVSQLGQLCKQVYRLEAEFVKIPLNKPHHTHDDIPIINYEKNRYMDILPNYETQVPLETGTGYINANFIRGYRSRSKAYIATQGPMQNTVDDFWNMVWQQNVSVIVMVTNLMEGAWEKCFQYWPNAVNSMEHFGNHIAVSITNKLHKKHFTVTEMVLEKNVISRKLTHLWFNDWPDHGVPMSTGPVIQFIKEYRKVRNLTIPTVVHCSAGIGRTGVFIAADIGMAYLDKPPHTVDIQKIVSTIRQDRGGLIETEEQYVFLYQTLNDYAQSAILKNHEL